MNVFLPFSCVRIWVYICELALADLFLIVYLSFRWSSYLQEIQPLLIIM